MCHSLDLHYSETPPKSNKFAIFSPKSEGFRGETGHYLLPGPHFGAIGR